MHIYLQIKIQIRIISETMGGSIWQGQQWWPSLSLEGKDPPPPPLEQPWGQVQLTLTECGRDKTSPPDPLPSLRTDTQTPPSHPGNTIWWTSRLNDHPRDERQRWLIKCWQLCGHGSDIFLILFVNFFQNSKFWSYLICTLKSFL